MDIAKSMTSIYASQYLGHRTNVHGVVGTNSISGNLSEARNGLATLAGLSRHLASFANTITQIISLTKKNPAIQEPHAPVSPLVSTSPTPGGEHIDNLVSAIEVYKSRVSIFSTSRKPITRAYKAAQSIQRWANTRKVEDFCNSGPCFITDMSALLTLTAKQKKGAELQSLFRLAVDNIVVLLADSLELETGLINHAANMPGHERVPLEQFFALLGKFELMSLQVNVKL